MLTHWHRGEDWFWDCLVDADLASNAASWQWIAGCGADAAPYFRIFNPILQSKKFDKNGEYIKHFVPELKDMPAKHIHAPWEAPEEVLKEAGKEYPQPMMDHSEARERALEAFQSTKKDEAA
jgi:deoxyribodipyrimidine photo-lyase